MKSTPPRRIASTTSGEVAADVASPRTSLVLAPGLVFDSVKVFAATKFSDREVLGEVVTQWIAQHPEHRITEIAVRQSSDSQFHCVTLIVFYRAR